MKKEHLVFLCLLLVLLSACGGTSPDMSGDGTTPITGSSLTVSSATQPLNSLAPEGASRLPFTTFILTAGTERDEKAGPFAVERTGLGSDAAFAGVVLLDEDGTQIGISKTFNSNHQAFIGEEVIIPAGTSKKFTVAGNMVSDLSERSGEVVSIELVAIFYDKGSINGFLPIVGASHTVNSTLAIGLVVTSRGPNDPNHFAVEEIGLINQTFSEIRACATIRENTTIKSIRWNQSGSISSDDLSNVVVVVDDTEYPTTVSSGGRYYTAEIDEELPKELCTEISVVGDIVGGVGRSIKFDIEKDTDLYVVGETYGYGITPFAVGTSQDSIGSSQFTSGTPWYSASAVVVESTEPYVSLDPEYYFGERWYVSGETAVVAGYNLLVLHESFSVRELEFTLNEGSPADIENISVWSGEEEIVEMPSPAFVGGTQVLSLDYGNLDILAREDTPLWVEVQFSEIGVVYPGTSGNLVQISLTNLETVGRESGITLSVPVSLSIHAGARYFKSLPTVQKLDLSNQMLLNGFSTLYEFSVSADEAGDVEFHKGTFAIQTNSVDADSFRLVESDTGLVVAEGDLVGEILEMLVDLEEIYIPQGTTRTFKLQAQVSNASEGSSVEVRLLGDAYNGSSNFIWSDTTAGYNGFGVPGLQGNNGLESETLTYNP